MKSIENSKFQYWKKRLEKKLPKNSTLTAFKANAKDLENYEVEFQINKELIENTFSYINKLGIKKEVFLLSVFNIILSKNSGQEDIIVGMPIYEEKSYSLNSDSICSILPIRNYPISDKTFMNFLKEVNENLMNDFKNYNFTELVNVINNDRNSYNTSEICFNFMDENNRNNSLRYHKNIINNIELLLEIKENKKEYNCVLKCNALKEETIFRFKEQYINVLKQVVENIDIKISDIDIISDYEKNLILNNFNNTCKDYMFEKTIHKLFEEQVKRTPDNIAVIFKDDHLTYKEVNNKANQLARLLRKKGVKQDSIVGIMLDRSFEMIIGIMAILKAGGAYLPIASHYPIQRIKYMVKDSKMTMLLCNEKCELKLREIDKQIDILNIENKDIYIGSCNNLKNLVTSKNLAYVIYTSGSTGNPKGVMIEHHSVINRISWMQNKYPLSGNDVILQKTPYTFDVSVWEIFWWIFVGAKVCMLSPNGEKDPEIIIDAINKNKVTTLHFVPSMMNVFLDYIEDLNYVNYIKKLKSIKQVFCSGEALHVEQANRFNSMLNKEIGAKLTNLYGPTEATVDVSYYDCFKESESVPIGKPIDNIQLYVLDKEKKLQPIGVQGELYISGVGLSRGYLNNPNLTSEKFIDNPFVKGEKMYKTGDLAKWNCDGNIEYLGRIDHQVKIRGFRIELGEIEKEILKYRNIKEAVVIDKMDNSNNRYLCSYIVSDSAIDVKELKSFLSETLIEYMIPSHIIQLPKMPLTDNGKLDRKKLPEPNIIKAERKYIAPKTELEKTIESIWKEVFRLNNIGIKDDFIELGGHSLKAISIVSKIRRKLKLNIMVSDIFKNPTIEMLSKYIEEIKSQSQLNGFNEFETIISVPEKSFYETSFVQKRMYAINQIDVKSINYNEPEIYIIDRKIDKKRFENALNRLINRHESLRTSFHVIDGEIVQNIYENVEIPVQYLKFNDTFDNLKQDIIKEFNNLICPFNLGKPPLMRIFIFELKDRDILLFDIHHIITDGVSSEIIIKDFLDLYEGKTLNDIDIKYKDFAHWQNNLYKQGYLKNQEEYWVNKFKGDIPVLNMPTDYTRPIYQNFEGNTIFFNINDKIASKLDILAKKKGVTQYMLLATAFIIMLSRYSGQEDVVIGTPSSGRKNESLDGIVGMFVNSLAIRSKVNSNDNFEKMLDDVKKTLLEAFENQDYDFGNLVQKLDIKQEQGRNPIFDIMFSVQDFNLDYENNKNIKLKRYLRKDNIAKLDMTVIINDKYQGLIQYKTKLFRSDTIERFIKNYENILKQIVSNIDIKIKEIDIAGENEQKIITDVFNDVLTNNFKSKTVKELFEETAWKMKDAIAIYSKNNSINYETLNKKANQIAHRLKKKAISRNEIIGVLCERNIETIISMLGVIKSGAAYLPIDNNYPKARKKYMIQDSGCKILLGSTEQLVDKDFDDYNIDFIDIDDDDINKESMENLQEINELDDLMYVIYTSGSTGKPKGVCLHQKGLLGRVLQNNKDNKNERILQIISMSFDPSIMDIWRTLLNGKKLYLASNEEIMDLNNLENIVKQHKITSMQIPSALFSNIISENINVFNEINEITVGGDILSSKSVAELLKVYPNIKIKNAYGPTENTIVSTEYIIENTWDENETIPIGKPVNYSKAYIVDNCGKLSPIGVSGELLVGGLGVAKGYLNRIRLTKEKFIESPFVKGEKLYKTGDLAKWLPDGNIEFLGRIDNQVKIRGFRVELSEIQIQILKDKRIREAVVIERKDNKDTKYLCAYIVSDEKISVDKLKESLNNNLPHYMVPPHIIQIKKIPMTSNGKVDRNLLPEPDLSQNNIEYVKPINEKEQIMADVWEEVLGIEKVGTNHNFYDIGGDSIKAIQIVSRLVKYKIKIEVKDILKYKTIKNISNYIEEFEVILPQELVEGTIELTPIIKDFTKTCKETFNHFNQSMMVYSKVGFDENIVENVTKRIIIHHDALRSVLKYDGGKISMYNKGKYDKLFNFIKVDFTKNDEYEKLIELEAEKLQESFDVEEGPLVNIALFKTKKGDHLLFIIHHLVVDGMSWRIFFEDFLNGYKACQKGKEINFPLKTTSFKNWAEKQYEHANSKKFLKEIEYWKNIIPQKSLGKMPKYNTVKEILFKDMKSKNISLSQDMTNKLLRSTNKAYNTEINDILLSALGLSVKKWSGNDKVAVMLEGHGRENIIENTDITRTIGWFTSCFPVILDSTDNYIGKNIKRNKEILRRVPNKGIGFGILKHLTEECNKDNLKLDIKTDISFNYLGQFDEDINNCLFEFSNIYSGKEISPNFKVTDSIQINSIIKNGKLDILIEYNKNEYADCMLEKFTNMFKEQLELIIEHCCGMTNVEYTPIDYGINYYTLEDLEEIKSFVKENIGEHAIIESINKLTPIQQGMLYTYLNDKSTNAYVLQMELSVKGNLNIDILNKAYNEILNRYSILRTAIYNHWKHPAQIVIENRQAEVIYKDFSNFNNREIECEKYEKELINKGFNLMRDVLFKISAIKLDEEIYRVILTVHHIIIDGWSNSIVINELFNIYRSIEKNEILPKNLVRYDEYLSWFFKQDKEQALSYWQNYLEDYSEPFMLSNENNNLKAYKEGFLDYSLDSSLSEKLDKVAVKCNVTLNTICEVAWGLVLQKYTKDNDVVFGTVVAGRSSKINNIEKMVGIFINTIPVRIKTNKNETLRDIIKKVQDESNNAKKYEYIALSEIQELTPLKDSLIQNIMVFENYPINNKYYEENLEIKELKAREQTNYSLNIAFEKKDTLKIQYMYDKNVYNDEFIQQINDKLILLFKTITNNIETLIKDIEKVDDIEKKKILVDFNSTKTNCKNNKTVKELFEDQVIKCADKIAVVSKKKEITYRELNEKANQISHMLKEKGVSKGSIVPIICDRSIETIISILGVIKAGGAYLPIDEEYPESRIKYMLKDSESKIILLKNEHFQKINLDEIDIEFVKTDDRKLLNQSIENLENNNGSDDLAYVIYTSGSTGNPKGVCCKNKGLVNLVTNKDYINKEYTERVLQSGSLSFDASVFQIWSALLNEGTFYIEDKNLIIDGEALKDYLYNNKITLMLMPTSLFNEYSQYDPKIFKNMKCLIIGGDVVSSKGVANVKKLFNYLIIFNAYGPTENSVVSTMYEIQSGWNSQLKVPIGKPISNATAYVMDENNRLLPIGVAGELCVGGYGLASGYLNREDFTKEKFIRNPYNQEEIIYKTGDLVKWLPDGNLEFIGRIDNQVKINGFRIELGEIEAKLLKHKEIKSAVVIDRLDIKDKKYLCGYIVASRNISFMEIKEFLRNELPNYMIPSYIMQLNSMPMTPNGKIDRKSLPKPDFSKQSDNEYIAPRDKIEEKMVNIWSEVLGVENIGIRDSFYDIGGDSIKSMQIVSRLRRYGFVLEIKDILEYKTIELLSKHVKKDKIKFSQEEVEGEISLTPIMKKFIGMKKKVFSHFNQSMMIYSDKGFDENIVKKVMESIIMHHDVLRSVLKYNNNNITMYNNNVKGKLFDFIKFDLKGIIDIEKAIENEGEKLQQSIDIENGPLVKAALFSTKTKDYLLFIVHHIAIDGMSWRILFEDFYNGYETLQNGQEIKLPLKTTSFREWTKKQNEYANSNKCLKELKYWKNIISTKSLEKMPKYNTCDKLLFKDMVSKSINFDNVITNKLLKETNKAYNTEINDILLSVLGISVKQWSGNNEVSIMLEGHGRENILDDVDINRTIGWFTSCYPVILDLKDNDISLNIKRNKEILRKIPNKGIGYGILKYLSKDNNIEEIDIKPEISFNYLGQFDQDTNNSLFKSINLPHGSDESVEFEAISGIQINSIIQDGCLKINIEFNKKEYKEKVIDDFVTIFKEKLIQVVNHCSSKKEPEYTPVDYGLNEYTLEDVENLKTFVKSNIDNKAIVSKINKLSSMQEGMLFTYLKNENTSAYVLQIEFNVYGNLNLNVLNDAYKHLLYKHDILRSIIYNNSNHSAQVVLDNRDVEINYEDFTKEINFEKAYEEYIKDLLRKGFDLSKDSLFKINVVKIENEKYRLILSIHHIIVDGWSNALIINDLFDSYEKLEKGNKLNIEKSTSYSEYIKWLDKQDKDQSIEYWREYLKDYNHIATLPKKDIKEDVECKQISIIEEIDVDTTRMLQEMANKYNVTLNTICQTAWGLLLQKYTNSDDVVFGMVVSGRPPEIKGIEDSIGIFLNTIPIRINNKNSLLISDLLNKVQNEFNMSNKYQYIALSDIQEQSELKQNLIDHITVFENYPESKDSNKESTLKIEEFNGREQTSYDLDISFILEDNLKYRIMYNENVYENYIINKITKQLKVIFKTIAQDCNKSLSNIEIVCEEEKKELLSNFNNTKKEYEKDKTVKEVFEEQVIKFPNKIAVVSKGDSLSYKELNEKSNEVAYMLKERGVGKGTIVPIICDKSIETIISIIAIVKVGAAYLPIDENYPESRIRYMIQDSKSKVVLGKKIQCDKVCSENINVEFIRIYNKSELKSLKENLKNANESDDLAYVIYTSGSTGNPKGVCIKNKGLINLVKNTSYMRNGNIERILQAGSLSFDASVFQIWLALLNGGTIYLEDKNLIIDGQALEEYINKNKITFMLMPTPLFNQYSQDRPEIFKNMKTLLIGGDVISSKGVAKIKRLYENLKLFNAYGPTENSVISTIYEIKHSWDENNIVPIGKPIFNSTSYVLDKNNKLLPIGVAGELCVGGDGIAEGYLNRRELTQEKFIENPYKQGEIIYKTGDLVKWLPDGNLDFIGRIDNQVKINGFRIELGEIESKLLKYDDIKSAVVIDSEDDNGNKYLCAYIEGIKKVSLDELKEYLSYELPKYMIPSYIIQIDEMPLTPNGKFDRKALPKPNFSKGLNGKYTAPRSEVEENLVNIWREVLGENKIGIEDNFFELGGHSLKATSLVLKILNTFNVKIKIQDIFEKPTIKEMAIYVEDLKKSIKEINIKEIDIAKSYNENFCNKKIERAKFKEYYELSSAQKRMYAINQLNMESTNYNVTGAYLIKGKLDIVKLENSFKEIINRHESLRTKFDVIDGVFIQKIQETTSFKLVHVECGYIDENNEKEVSELINKHIKPFSLDKPPLIRVCLIKLKSKSILLIDMHHIITDGVSMNIIIKELVDIYEDKKLKPVELQYKDFSEWQNNLINTGKMKKQEDFWLKYLSHNFEKLDLPKDYVKDDKYSFKGERIDIKFSKETLLKINDYSKKMQLSKFIFMLTNLNVLLNKYTLQENILIGSPISGRCSLELNNIVGMFVNTLPIKNVVDNEMTFETFLNKVKVNSLKVFENQDYQIEVMLQEFMKKGYIKDNNVFDVLFLYQHNNFSSISIGDAILKEIELKTTVSKNELTIVAMECNGELIIQCIYDSCSFDKETINEFLDNYKKIVIKVLEEPKILLKDIEFIEQSVEKEEMDIQDFSFNF